VGGKSPSGNGPAALAGSGHIKSQQLLQIAFGGVRLFIQQLHQVVAAGLHHSMEINPRN